MLKKKKKKEKDKEKKKQIFLLDFWYFCHHVYHKIFMLVIQVCIIFSILGFGLKLNFVCVFW